MHVNVWSSQQVPPGSILTSKRGKSNPPAELTVHEGKHFADAAASENAVARNRTTAHFHTASPRGRAEPIRYFRGNALSDMQSQQRRRDAAGLRARPGVDDSTSRKDQKDVLSKKKMMVHVQIGPYAMDELASMRSIARAGSARSDPH